jgi:hypothetical protein
MLADSLYVREPRWYYADPSRIRRPLGSSLRNYQTALHSFPRLRLPVRAITRIRAPIDHLYVSYAPIVASTAAKSS